MGAPDGIMMLRRRSRNGGGVHGRASVIGSDIAKHVFQLHGARADAIDWNPIDFAASAPRVRRNGRSFGFELSTLLKTGYVRSSFVAEGGALTTDGQGLLVTTRSYLLHPRRNPACSGISRQLRLEREFRSFGIESVTWLEGDPAEPLTHDGYVLMTSPGRVLVERVRGPDVEAPFWRTRDIILLKQAHDASGCRLHVEFVAAPRKRRWKFRGPY